MHPLVPFGPLYITTPLDYQRNAKASVCEGPFESWKRTSMVAVEYDGGLIVKAVLSQL